MKQIEDIIFPLVQTHFPDFYRDEGPRFIDFVKEYYRWMESDGGVVNASRNLLDYRNIDTTSDEFVQYFKNKYLVGVSLSSEANTRFLVKHAADIYKAKGTERGVQLVVQGLFNEEAKVYFPGDDLFKTSDGVWVKPTYLELSVSTRTPSFVGKEVIGSQSGAKAFIEGLVTRRISGKYLQVAYLSNVRGNFSTGEFVTPVDDTNLADAPSIIGSMSNLTVVSGGANFQIGDIFDVFSSNGKQGKARVTEVSNETGKVTFIFIDAFESGGWGYSTAHTNVIVSSKVLTLTDITNANSSITRFDRFEAVTQPLVNIAYSTARGNNFYFDAGYVVENFNADGSVNANGIIVASDKTNNTTGYIIVSPDTGNLSSVDTTFAVRAVDPVIADFNASLVGTAFNTYTASYTGSYSGTYTGQFTGSFTDSYSGVYQSSFTGLFARGWTGLRNDTTYTAAYSSAYTGQFSNVFTGVYNSTATSSFTNFFVAYFVSNPYTQTAYTGISFTGIYTQAGYTGSYGSASFTGPVGPYSNQAYAGAWSGAFTATFTGAYTSAFNRQFTSTFTTTYTTGVISSYTGSFSGSYAVEFTAAYSGMYTGDFTGAYSRAYSTTFAQTFSGAYAGAYNQGYTGTYTNATRINTTTAHLFSNGSLVRYRVAPGNTAITGLVADAAYYVVNAVAGSTSLSLSDTFGGTPISLVAGSNETGHQLIETLGTAVMTAYADRTATGNVVGSNATYVSFKFNANSGVANVTNIITTTAAHTLENNFVVRYLVSLGNTAISGLTVGDSYYVVNATTTSFQLALTRDGAPVDITAGSNETGHMLEYETGFMGVTDLSSNGFVATPYANVVGLTTNTTATITSISTGTGADFEIGSLTYTENVFLSPDFLSSNNTGNVVFHSVRLNGFNSNVSASGYGTDDTFNASSGVTGGTNGTGVLLPSSVQFNANSGVANTTDIITTSTVHVFSNNELVTYAVHPTNTAISGLTSGSNYYVINTTPGSSSLQLSLTSGGAAINITAGTNETGHSLTRAGTTGSNNTIAFSNAINYIPNTAVRYYVSAGNTVVGGLTTNTVYYVDQSNATHISLKATKTGNRIALTSGSSETGHHLVGPLKVLTGANSTYGNVGSGDIAFKGLGFVKFPGASMDTILLDALRFDATTVGSIASIVGINPGNDYNVDPFVAVIDTYVMGYNKRDYNMTITNVVGTFLEREQIQQTYDLPATQLTVNTFAGTYANGVTATSFVVGEFVYQSNSTANVAASGFVLEAGIDIAGAGTLKVANVTGTFVTTSNTTTLLKGLSSGSTSNVSAASLTTYTTTARAMVKPGSNSSVLKLKRINLENTFLTTSAIIGRTSGATANVVAVDQDATTLTIGTNANIEANVQTSNNVVTKMAVHDSGFGYQDQEVVTMTKEGSSFSVTAIVGLGKQGVGAGYYASTKGFLDDDKKLQDNDYYQEYSYEVQTKIPLDKYVEVLKQVTHVAGTKTFGSVRSISTANLTMTAINNIEIS